MFWVTFFIPLFSFMLLQAICSSHLLLGISSIILSLVKSLLMSYIGPLFHLHFVYSIYLYIFLCVLNHMLSASDNWGIINCSSTWTRIEVILGMCGGNRKCWAFNHFDWMQNHFLLTCACLGSAGCKWLWSRTCCLWILHPSIYTLRRRSLGTWKLHFCCCLVFSFLGA